jgi:hypothetical protein
MNEAKLIQADLKAFSSRDAAIAKLDGATNQRQIKQLSKMATRFNNQVVSMTAALTLFSAQAYDYAVNLSPPNSGLVSQSLAALLTVQSLSVAAGLGVAPATPIQ